MTNRSSMDTFDEMERYAKEMKERDRQEKEELKSQRLKEKEKKSLFCHNCKLKLYDHQKFCSGCGTKVINVFSYSNEGSHIKVSVAKQISIDPDYMKAFNWPLFTFPLLYMWSMKYRFWEVLCVWLVHLIPLLGLVAPLVFASEGKSRAYHNRKWESDEQFIECQNVWREWTAAFWIVISVIALIGVGINLTRQNSISQTIPLVQPRELANNTPQGSTSLCIGEGYKNIDLTSAKVLVLNQATGYELPAVEVGGNYAKVCKLDDRTLQVEAIGNTIIDRYNILLGSK